MEQRTAAVSVRNVTKRFGPVLANDKVCLDIYRGEILALLGENGSGKTTLMNMLSGIYYPDEGEIYINGKPVSISSPKESFHLGIGMIHQHFKLVDVFTAAENIILGLDEKLDMKSAIRKIRKICDQYGFDIDPNQKIYDMSVSQKQTIEIIKVLYRGADILLLDEPTAGMDALSRRQMWNLLRKLNGKNLTILLTTHYMEEAQNLCSRVALMDHGKLEEVNTPAGLIDSLGNYTVDEFAGDETHSHYFHSREEAIAYLSDLSGQASLRETTLEDVFVERAGRHLMPS